MFVNDKDLLCSKNQYLNLVEIFKIEIESIKYKFKN